MTIIIYRLLFWKRSAKIFESIVKTTYLGQTPMSLNDDHERYGIATKEVQSIGKRTPRDISNLRYWLDDEKVVISFCALLRVAPGRLTPVPGRR